MSESSLKETLAELMDREFKLQAIVNCSPSALSLKTPDGVYALANPNLQKIHHRPEQDIIGKTDFDLYPEEVAQQFRLNDQLVLESKTRHSIEEQVPVDGQMLSFMSHIFPVFEEGGSVKFICRISLDITDKKRAEAEVRKHQLHLEQLVESRTQELSLAKIAAESANKAKSTFLSTMSHEIRNPLGGIKGVADILAMHPLEGELKELVAIQKSAIEQLSGLLNDVLDYSKIEAGKFEFDVHSFDLDSMIEDVAKLKRIRCQQKGLSFTLTKSYAASPQYVGDPVRVRQVIQNLLSNAYKFTNKGGIALSVKTEPIHEDSDLITITVSDTGSGIKAEDQLKLFQPFVQASQAERVRAQGTGLGLSIVKSLVESMGGQVQLTSEYGKRSVFTVSIPLPKAPASEREFSKTSPGTVVKQMRILLVDDDTLSRKVVSSLLKKMGHDVHTVSNGAAALSELQAQAFDVVLTDYSMPDMSGIELLQQVKLDPSIARCPRFFCLTGHTQKELVKELLTAGFDAYFSKPLNVEAFGQRLIELGQP